MPLVDSLPSQNFDASDWVSGKKLMGKTLAELLRHEIKSAAESLAIPPGLAVILVGEDPASQVYVAGKEKAAALAGFHSRMVRLKENATQEEVVAQIHSFNHDASIHGILVQLPLPKHLNEEQILQAIVADKDADGFHYLNQGKLLADKAATLPCTPAGIALMLRELSKSDEFLDQGLTLEGKHAVVVGRSNIVGKPMAQLLLSAFHMTVTQCHSRTKNLSSFISSADVLVSATGVRGIIDLSVMKKGAVVIDVGMHRDQGKLTGDLDLSAAHDKASFFTPVPGGVGPMTIAMLLFNTLQNARRLQELPHLA